MARNRNVCLIFRSLQFVHCSSVCNKNFSRLVGLKYHRYQHTDDRPHKCSKCGAGFIRKNYLRNHKCSNHESDWNELLTKLILTNHRLVIEIQVWERKPFPHIIWIKIQNNEYQLLNTAIPGTFLFRECQGTENVLYLILDNLFIVLQGINSFHFILEFLNIFWCNWIFFN